MVSESEPSTGAAFAGRSARACDNCIKKRARWYCAADDAFLCQSCDSSVHSANLLSRRHQRLRLKTSSGGGSRTVRKIAVPSWPQGFTCKKPRTPRRRKKKNRGKFKSISRIINGDFLRLVPEVDQFSGEENEEEQQLVYRVPVFDPLNDALSADISKTTSCDDETQRLQKFVNQDCEFLGDDIVDVERLLEDEEGSMEGLGILNFENCNKIEEEGNRSRKTFLKLDYDGVLSAWNGRRSPWMAGRLNLAGGDCSGVIGGMGAADGGREARVWRYREKRRRRLYAKKIRYEVRKVNAEKRPRIKGRFVKRTAQAN